MKWHHFLMLKIYVLTLNLSIMASLRTVICFTNGGVSSLGERAMCASLA